MKKLIIFCFIILFELGGNAQILTKKIPDRLVIFTFDDATASQYSIVAHVNETTSPTWLTHAGNDSMVPVENNILFYQALIKHKLPAEMHLYPRGNHGFITKIPTDEWMQPLVDWINKRITVQ